MTEESQEKSPQMDNLIEPSSPLLPSTPMVRRVFNSADIDKQQLITRTFKTPANNRSPLKEIVNISPTHDSLISKMEDVKQPPAVSQLGTGTQQPMDVRRGDLKAMSLDSATTLRSFKSPQRGSDQDQAFSPVFLKKCVTAFDKDPELSNSNSNSNSNHDSRQGNNIFDMSPPTNQGNNMNHGNNMAEKKKGPAGPKTFIHSSLNMLGRIFALGIIAVSTGLLSTTFSTTPSHLVSFVPLINNFNNNNNNMKPSVRLMSIFKSEGPEDKTKRTTTGEDKSPTATPDFTFPEPILWFNEVPEPVESKPFEPNVLVLPQVKIKNTLRKFVSGIKDWPRLLLEKARVKLEIFKISFQQPIKQFLVPKLGEEVC